MQRDGAYGPIERIPADGLKRTIEQLLAVLDVPSAEATIVADVLVAADLRGIPSHGVSRVPSYARRVREGRIRPRTSLNVLRESPTTLVLDAGQGWGHVAGRTAMQRCIEKAKTEGVCFAAVRRSTHFGIAAYYAMLPLDHGMIGFALSNSRPHIAPTFGRTPVLGTNPIAVAVPAGEELPFVLDMATSAVAMGRVDIEALLQRDLPAGWGIDHAGNPCADPNAVREEGALLPLGGFAETSGYKGYGLALMVDLLAGLLAGAGFGPMMAETYDMSGPDIGHLFGAVAIERFRPVEAFRRDVDRLIRAIRASAKAPGCKRIYVAGEGEFEAVRYNRIHGVPIPVRVMESLREEARRCGTELKVPPTQ